LPIRKSQGLGRNMATSTCDSNVEKNNQHTDRK
jgi:hypothetical protein